MILKHKYKHYVFERYSRTLIFLLTFAVENILKIRYMKKSLILSAILLAVNCQAAFGWGQKGHDIVAYIAQQHLTKKAQKAIGEILDGRSIVYYSSWMDNLQNSPAWQDGYDATATWHYANVDEGHTYETMRKEPKGDVLTALEMVISKLKSDTLTDSLRSDYLRMLVHMVGDMHCPMHAGRLSDLGGNQHQIRFFGQETNLHSIWDTAMIDTAHKWSYTEWQRQLDRYTKKERQAIAEGTLYDWFVETVAAAKMLYDATPVGAELGYRYLYDFTPLLETQLLHAGYRLAAILNDIFG